VTKLKVEKNNGTVGTAELRPSSAGVCAGAWPAHTV
jgi:hypothetical protein